MDLVKWVKWGLYRTIIQMYKVQYRYIVCNCNINLILLTIWNSPQLIVETCDNIFCEKVKSYNSKMLLSTCKMYFQYLKANFTDQKIKLLQRFFNSEKLKGIYVEDCPLNKTILKMCLQCWRFMPNTLEQ